MEVSLLSAKDSKIIAKIHYNNFKNSFLCDLGLDFLNHLYYWVLSLNKGFGYSIKVDNSIIGFITGVYDSSDIISLFVKKNFLSVLPIILKSCLKKPKNLKRIIETLFYAGKTNIDIKAELLSIAIKHTYRHKGFGQLLFGRFIEHLHEKKIDSFKITVDHDNKRANQFYSNLGCRLKKSYVMFGKVFNIYSFGES